MKPKLDPASQRTQGQLFDEVGLTLVDFIDMKNPLVDWRILCNGNYSKIIGAISTVVPAAPWPVPEGALLDS